jgi:hypothetical protein
MKRILLVMLLVTCAGLGNVSRGQTPVETEKVRNIRRLMEITGSHNLAHQMIEQMMASVKKSMPSDKPELSEKIFNIYKEELHKAFTVERVNAYIVPIYDKYFTGDELIALIAFYESSLGKKVVSALPQIFTEASVAGEQLGREVQQRATERIANEVLPTLENAPDARPAAKRRPARRQRT